MVKIDVLLGLQWGDEGKGKVVDALTPGYDAVTRFQGGPNAGHTLEFNHKKFILHTIPSGIFHKDTLNIIGNGLVIDPVVFSSEIESLEISVKDLTGRLIISSKSHLILPTHKLLDEAYEESKGEKKIGSTLRGIGPAYTDKASRNGLRIGDILRDDFQERYQEHKKRHLDILRRFNSKEVDREFEERWFEGIGLIKRFSIENTEYMINRLSSQGKKVIAEGAQGTLLDIDFGSYPFVTSSNTITAGACTGMGTAPGNIGEVFGIFKAYCTRVGSGPFPTELNDDTGQLLRDNGAEYGSTTGRPRRCGWLDLPALKYSCMINGVTQLFMTKADVLTGLDVIRVCNSYNVDNERTSELPFDHSMVTGVEYSELKGWNSDITGIRNYQDLPSELKTYIRMIEDETGVPVRIVSVGPDREQTIFRN